MHAASSNCFGRLQHPLAPQSNRRAVTLPKDYANFLLECNGGCPFPDAFLAPCGKVEVTVFQIYSLLPTKGFLQDLVTLCSEPSLKDAVEAGFLHVAEDSGGQRILMLTKGPFTGRMLIEIDRGYYLVASSFNDFLRKLERRHGLQPDFLDGLKENRIRATSQEERGFNYVIGDE